MNRTLHNRWRVAVVCCLLAQPVHAQTRSTDGLALGGSLAWGSLWDDETHLGPGPALAVEATTPLGPHLRGGVDLGWLPHRRDSGYLAASGHALSATVHTWLLVGSRHWRTRPFIGTGIGAARSIGEFTTTDPFTQTTVRQSWALTRFTWDLALGLRIATGERWALRPELRAGVIGGAGVANTIQTPLLRLQAGVGVEWIRP